MASTLVSYLASLKYIIQVQLVLLNYFHRCGLPLEYNAVYQGYTFRKHPLSKADNCQ